MLCVVIFSVFVVLFPKGGMLRFYLEPARSKGRCLGYEAIAAGALATKLLLPLPWLRSYYCRCLDYEGIAAVALTTKLLLPLATKLLLPLPWLRSSAPSSTDAIGTARSHAATAMSAHSMPGVSYPAHPCRALLLYTMSTVSFLFSRQMPEHLVRRYSERVMFLYIGIASISESSSI